jgi:hypothetical protein
MDFVPIDPMEAQIDAFEKLLAEEQPSKKKKSRRSKKKKAPVREDDELSELSDVAPGDSKPEVAEVEPIEDPVKEEESLKEEQEPEQEPEADGEPMAEEIPLTVGGGSFSLTRPFGWLQEKLGISETMLRYGAMPFAFVISLLIKLIFYFVTRSQVVVTVRAITKNSNACVIIDSENKHYHFQEDTILRWFGIQTMNRTLWRDIYEGKKYKLYLSGGSLIQAVEVIA